MPQGIKLEGFGFMYGIHLRQPQVEGDEVTIGVISDMFTLFVVIAGQNNEVHLCGWRNLIRTG